MLAKNLHLHGKVPTLLPQITAVPASLWLTEQRYSEYSPGSATIAITWELVRKATFQAPMQTS